jgi:hypothetical protein
MTFMRMKLQVLSVANHGGNYEQVEMSAVAKSDGYPADGSDEDNTFARWTPSATLKYTVNNPNLFGKLRPGMKLYADFEIAE